MQLRPDHRCAWRRAASWAASLLLVYGLVSFENALAQHQKDATTPTTSVPPPVTSAAVPPVSDGSDTVEAIRYEREVLERQADRQMSAVLTLAQIATGVVSAIFAIAAAIFFWLFGSTRKELRESLHETANKQIQDLVEKQAELVRKRVQRIEAELDALRGQRSVITWIARDEADANNEVLALLQTRDIDVSAVLPDEGQPFEVGNPELVVISYLATAEGRRRIEEVIRQLRDRTPQVPIVVYTFGAQLEANRLRPEDEAVLGEYRWYVPANFPL
jgi:hypothetical protein